MSQDLGGDFICVINMRARLYRRYYYPHLTGKTEALKSAPELHHYQAAESTSNQDR